MLTHTRPSRCTHTDVNTVLSSCLTYFNCRIKIWNVTLVMACLINLRRSFVYKSPIFKRRIFLFLLFFFFLHSFTLLTFYAHRLRKENRQRNLFLSGLWRWCHWMEFRFKVIGFSAFFARENKKKNSKKNHLKRLTYVSWKIYLHMLKHKNVLKLRIV